MDADPDSDLPLFADFATRTPRRGAQRTSADGPARVRTTTNDGEQVRLLTVADVCERLRCGRTYVYELIQHGLLHAVKLGRLTRIPLPELERFVTEKVADAQRELGPRRSRGDGRAAM